MIRFSWDERKNENNKKKHKVSFDETKPCFMMKMPSGILILTILPMRIGF